MGGSQSCAAFLDGRALPARTGATRLETQQLYITPVSCLMHCCVPVLEEDCLCRSYHFGTGLPSSETWRPWSSHVSYL